MNEDHRINFRDLRTRGGLNYSLPIGLTELGLTRTTRVELERSSLELKQRPNIFTSCDSDVIKTYLFREVTVRNRPISRKPHAGEWAANPLFLNEDYTQTEAFPTPTAVISFRQSYYTGQPTAPILPESLPSRIIAIQKEQKIAEVTPRVIEQALLEEQAEINNKHQALVSPAPARLVILDSGEFVFVGLEAAHVQLRVLDSHVKDPVNSPLPLTEKTFDQNGRRLVIAHGSVTPDQRLQALKDGQVICSVKRTKE